MAELPKDDSFGVLGFLLPVMTNMKILLIQRDSDEMNSMIRLAIRRLSAIILIIVLDLYLVSCGGGGGGGNGGDGSSSTDEVMLTATTGSSNSINISWTNPTGQYTWPPEEVFSYIYRGGVKISTAYGFSYSDTGLQPDTTYCYDVTVGAIYCFLFSCNSIGWQSNTACATTLPDTAPPSVPANVSAIALSASEIRLSWDKSVDNTAISGYRIYRDGTLFMTSSAIVIPYIITDTMLPSDTTYCYAVSAFDAAGNESAQSTAACATTLLSASIIDSSSDGSCKNNSMAIDSTDKLHITYIKESSPTTYELRYATNASGVWTKTTVGTSWGYPSIATDALNKVHIATTSQYISNTTGTWVTENYYSNATMPSIAVDKNGKIHIGFYVESPNRALLYANNLPGSWNAETISNTYLQTWPSLALDSNTKAHVAFSDGGLTDEYVHYSTNTSGSWQNLTIGGSFPSGSLCDFGEGLKIAVDSADKVHIVIRNKYYTNAAGSWTSEIFDPGGMCPSLTLDTSNAPHIAYSAYDTDTATYRLKHATKGQDGWSNTTLSVIYLPGGHFSIAVDSLGGIHVSYCNGGSISYLKK
jgi:hypothetical protein